MKKSGIHFDNSNLDEYDIGYLVTFTEEILNGKLLFCAVRLALKDKCVYSIDVLSATEMCGNADEDSYDDYDDVPSTFLSLSILAGTKLMVIRV